MRGFHEIRFPDNIAFGAMEAMAESLAPYEELFGAEIVTAARRANISSQGRTEALPLVTGPVVIGGSEAPMRRTYSTLH
ncbi:MAG: hypothetical protein R3F54_29580 [Alphaproteobacteria bacterium]